MASVEGWAGKWLIFLLNKWIGTLVIDYRLDWDRVCEGKKKKKKNAKKKKKKKKEEEQCKEEEEKKR